MLNYQTKDKPCKGLNKAKGRGCGTHSDKRKLGLCHKCYFDYLKETNQLNSFLASAKRKAVREQKKEMRVKKESIKTKGKYEAELQKEINAIVRLIDQDKGCISCKHGWTERFTRQAHAGHRLSVGSHVVLRYHLYNIFKQCSICNDHLSGNPDGYDKGLLTHYGTEALIRIDEIRLKYQSLHLSIDDLKDKIVIARQIKRAILKGETYSRDKANAELCIYN